MDPMMVARMDAVISGIVELLEGGYHIVRPYDGPMQVLKEELMRLRACYCTFAGAPSWYILQGCGSTSLPWITEVLEMLEHAEQFIDIYVEFNGINGDDLLLLTKRLKDVCPAYRYEKSAPCEDKEQAIFTLPMNHTGAAMVELKKQLMYLQKGFRIVGAVPSNEISGPDIVWLSQTRQLFHDADNLVDTSRDSSNAPLQITDVEIKKITERASLQVQLLSVVKGSRIRALYKHEQETEVVGADGPRDELLKMLAEEDGMPEKNMKGVIIVGTEGSGKTTLARLIYSHLKPQFDCAAFVTASTFSVSDDGPWEFFEEMASQLHPGRSIEKITEFLQNKRYLVVIDDVCSGSAWGDSIFPSFPNNDYGSRVIAICQTYDMRDIRWEFSNKSVYELPPLGHLDSEKLFLEQLVGREASCPNAPTNVIKEILRMCGHNPSAIVSIASVLATKVTTTKPWQEVMDSVYSDWKQMARSDYIPDFEDSRYIISLIYMHLPRPLNTCLLHLAVHAKNQIIRRTAIANKWAAEGFIHSCQTCDGEKLATMCFDALIRRNLIQLVEYGTYIGEEIYEVNYMIQNVLRKLAHDSRFAAVLPGQGSSPMSDMQSDRLLVQYSGSELSIQLTELSRIDLNYRSVTIVGPVKVYFDSDLAHLLVLDMDGCKGLDNSAMDRICRMINLRYLSIKHTQVTKITPEIGEMQCLETLDIRQTQISNLPPEIGTLQKLKILNARQTLIRCLPREVGKLQNLETLDVRQTQVKELPKEIVQLSKLAHLYFGQISSLGVVKLPVGSDQLKSVEVFGTVDSREWSESAMEEISGLTGVRELEVVLHDQPVDKIKNDKLLSSIGKCMQLKYLIINGDYNPNDDLLVSPNFPLIEKLKLAGRFVKIPRWLAQHRILKKLDFKVCKLDQDDLKILGGLPLLSTLALALISILRKKRVTITCRLHSSTCTDLHPLRETCPPGFTSLEVFNFDCHVPWITFEQGAMPSLKHLHLKLFACPADKFPSGIINLCSLEKIILRYSSQHASSGGVTNAVAAMREEASSHRNLICLSVNGYHEDFLPNARVDQTITGTEIKEDSNHGNRIERSINGDPEVLVTRVDETITGTETEEEASNHGDPIKLSVDGDREVLLSNTRADVTIAGTEIKECYCRYVFH